MSEASHEKSNIARVGGIRPVADITEVRYVAVMSADVTDSLAPKRWKPRKPFIKIVGFGALTCGYGAIPAFFDRGHTLDDIVHSGFVQVGLTVSFILFVLVYGSLGIQSRAESGRSPWPIYWGMLAVFLAVGMLVILVPSVAAHQLAVDLDTRGVQTQADVVRHFTEGCGRTGCRTGLEYAFSAGRKGHSFLGYVDEGNVSRHSNPAYEYALSTGTIPVLYDPERPSRSEVYWNDEVHRQARSGFISTTAKILIFFLLVFLLIVAGLLYPVARNASLDRSGVI